MTVTKRVERFCKRCIRNVLKYFLKPIPVKQEEFNPDSLSRILLIRQDSRIGNLVLMTPLIRGLKTSFPGADLSVLISEGFEEVYAHNPYVDHIILFRKKRARFSLLHYLTFIRDVRRKHFDLAIDVSDGYHFSLNNVLLTSLSGARYRLGYDRENAESFLNLVVPLPSEHTHIADAMLGLATYILPDLEEFPLAYYIAESERDFAHKWLEKQNIKQLDTFFVIHPGGRGKKQWGAQNFSALIDWISSEIGVRIIVIGGRAEDRIIARIRDLSKGVFDVLQGVTIGQMAAIIECCDMFISGDTGPMHISSSLGRPTVGIFISSDFRIYGPRGQKARIVIGKDGQVSINDVNVAIADLYNDIT